MDPVAPNQRSREWIAHPSMFSAGVKQFFRADTGTKAGDMAWGITLAVCWFWTWKQLSVAWSSYPNYEFGYVVPWIAILLALRRINAAPGCLEPVPPTRRAGILSGPALFVAWGLFLFAELVREYDPHWRMVSWMMMGSVTLLTGIALWQRGGGGLVRYLAFPVGFVWTAVPWPTNVENFITLNLRALVTYVSVAVLQAVGIHASQHGNIIDLPGGSVVMDSACSGISSLQASIMVSLFLGEFFNFLVKRRFALLAAGAFLAVGGNLIRAITLVLLANNSGTAAMLAYHDRIGYAETGGIFLALALVACWMSWKSTGISKQSGSRPGGAAKEITDRPRSLRNAPPGIWVGNKGSVALVAFLLVPFITWGWFALSPGGPVRMQNVPLWTLNANPAAADWHALPVELSPIDLRTLDFSEGQTISLTGPLATSALVYHFFWKTDASTGYGHTPDVCMASGGWEMEGGPVDVKLKIKDAVFPGKLYRFKRDGEEMVVFQSIWYGGEPLLSENEFPYAKGGPRTSRLAMLWYGPRRRGLESLNVYMTPAGSQEAQTRMAEEVLAQVLVPNHVP